MEFYVVEVKDNDLYTIYDPINGGVCCCSLYTLKQLVSMNCVVRGLVGKSNGRCSVIEYDLSGKPREKKASVLCDDLTKRSASTIIRGLDEKHYPRAKQSRRSTGSFVHLYMSKLQGVVDTKAIQVSQDKFLTINNEIVSLPYSEKAGERVVIKTTSVNPSEEKTLSELYILYRQKEAYNKEYEKLKKEYDGKIKKLEEEKAKVLADFNSDRSELENKVKQINEKGKEIASNFKYADVSGNELCSYDFYRNNGTNPVSREYIYEVARKSNRKFIYTYGLEYRNPTTHRKPISKEEALIIIKKNGLLTVDATNPEFIHVKEVSENDMW